MEKIKNSSTPAKGGNGFEAFLEKARHWFGGIDMTWGKVIIFAVATAVYTAVMNLIPAFKGTSFQDIAVYLEAWILFAMFIISNCKKWWEAALKCFVFFLVSQPLIYLIEVPFVKNGFGIFSYYKFWFVVTLLTLPGAAIAFFVRRKDWLGLAILSVATGFLAYTSADYFKRTASAFPHHLLSAIFCIALAVFFVLVFFKEKKFRIAGLALIAVVFIVGCCIGSASKNADAYLADGNYTVTVEDESVVSVELEDGNHAKFSAKRDGESAVFFENENGEQTEYYVHVGGGSIFVMEQDYD